ncbi:MAG TPA: nucleotide exchange factor GrpE [Xanthobacteraceae bacterium]|jgi:molecular chaperone GrpE|nr:nucleotide exchange factor GrpE [Xanthobacteraceae bacterium]
MPDTTVRASGTATDQNNQGADQAAPNSLADERPADAKEDRMVALAREAADYRDKLLRSLAEMENLRKRTERQVADARDYGIAAFARDILAVADNMERALGALDAELREKADAATKALLDGVELTERELLKVLEKHGVKKFEPLDEKFDPNTHQAMYEVSDPSRPAGTVAQVIQPGYMIGERVLRPALVAVAKGGPRASMETPANDNAGISSEEPPGSH